MSWEPSNSSLQNAAQEALESYKRKMNEKIWGTRYINGDKLYNFHVNCKSEAMREYRVHKHTSFLHDFEYHRNKLDKDMNEEFKIFKKVNKSRYKQVSVEDEEDEEECTTVARIVDSSMNMLRTYTPPSRRAASSSSADLDLETLETIVTGVSAIAAAAFVGYKIFESVGKKHDRH